MKPTYVLDACAMLAVLADEQGAEVVDEIYQKANSGDVILAVNKLNLLEVYYNLYRAYGKEHANNFRDEVGNLPIQIYHEISNEVFEEAGRLKSSYKISLADSIALAQALVLDGELLTCDHHEFDIVQTSEKIRFKWIR